MYLLGFCRYYCFDETKHCEQRVQHVFFRAHLMSESNDAIQFGESWLFYGCRHKEQDFLYRFVLYLLLNVMEQEASSGRHCDLRGICCVQH